MRMGTCIGSLICATAVVAAPSGYLRTLGPAPLRFQSAVAPAAAPSLPPLALRETPVPEAPSAPPAMTNAVAAAVQPAVKGAPPPASNVTLITAFQEAPAPARYSGFGSDLPKVIEMLMPSPGATNGANNRIVVLPAIPFTPPLPTPTPSSSATYHSPPDEPIKTP